MTLSKKANNKLNGVFSHVKIICPTLAAINEWSNSSLSPGQEYLNEIEMVISYIVEETWVSGENNRPSLRKLTNFLTLAFEVL